MKAILAVEKNCGIGYDGSIPWPKQTKDLQRFKELTLNQGILMGRKTWESTGMPKPLPNRTNVVISTKDLDLPDNVIQIKSLDEIKDLAFEVQWCIGGAHVIKQAWDIIDEIHLTRLNSAYECDTFFDLDKLEEDFRLKRSQLCLTHTYEIWNRK